MIELESGLTLRAVVIAQDNPNFYYEFQAATPFIEKFLKRSEGESTVESIKSRVASGDFQLWLIESSEELVGICVTKVDHWVSYSALHILGLGSKPGYWEIFRDAHVWMERLAHNWGCDRITMWTNRAWQKFFDKMEFTGENGETYEESYKVMAMKLK